MRIYTGRYHSDEIATTYEVKLDGQSGKLMLRTPQTSTEASRARPCRRIRIDGSAERTLKTAMVKSRAGFRQYQRVPAERRPSRYEKSAISRVA